MIEMLDTIVTMDESVAHKVAGIIESELRQLAETTASSSETVSGEVLVLLGLAAKAEKYAPNRRQVTITALGREVVDAMRVD